MSFTRRLAPNFAVSGQLGPADFAALAAAGFRRVVNNRPDGEEPGQLSHQEAEAAAQAAGLEYLTAPFRGAPTDAAIAAAADSITADIPTLAYCRSGTRSASAWALAMADLKRLAPEEILAAAGSAGYDLSALRALLKARWEA